MESINVGGPAVPEIHIGGPGAPRILVVSGSPEIRETLRGANIDAVYLDDYQDKSRPTLHDYGAPLWLDMVKDAMARNKRQAIVRAPSIGNSEVLSLPFEDQVLARLASRSAQDVDEGFMSYRPPASLVPFSCSCGHVFERLALAFSPGRGRRR